jgi:single-stranded-DNA-specific exonuclease
MNPHWKFYPPSPDIIDSLCRSLPCHPVTATVLANRGFRRPEDVDAFFNPSLSNLRPPFPMKDMETAVKRIIRALSRHEKIMIFGDYDVDGVTATAILFSFLRDAGADVSTYIPHRLDDGYGLSSRYIITQAIPSGIDLVITVDNGSSSYEAVDQARQVNIDVIIIDHHTIIEPFPEAVAVVNPKRTDCTAGLADLAGVGVVFALLICLRKHLRDTGFWNGQPEPNLKHTCDLVALGTVADMVPLRDDNRILTRAGMDIIRHNHSRPGLTALLALAKVAAENVDSEDIAYRLAPRLNAAGRMEHAETALSLLTTNDPDIAGQLARRIEILNTRRRKVQKNLIDRIHTNLKDKPDLLKGRSLVLWGEGWHEGVLGIAAAHFVRMYHRPVVLISTRDGVGKGSARSIPGFDLYRGLAAGRELLTGFGGHALAAGVKIKVDKLDEFQRRFETVVHEAIGKTVFTPDIRIDCELNLDDFSDHLLDELELLAPFGTTNPEPLFIARNVEVVSGKIVGKTHLNMRLRQRPGPSDRIFQAMQFNVDPQKKVPRIFESIVFRVGWNRWNQSRTARIIIEAV